MAYQIITSILRHNDSHIDAAEAHGIASALLVINLQCEAEQWLKEVFPDGDNLNEEDKSILVNLFEQTRTLLNPEEAMFEFDLFLPDDSDLQQHAQALSLWCQGFLWGIGYLQSQKEWSEESSEVLSDMVEFTKLDDQIEEDDEEAEDAVMQIREYLRAAVLLLPEYSDSSQ